MVPRLPIPNRTVKRLSADDSVVLPCESRSLPNTYSKPLTDVGGFYFDLVFYLLLVETFAKKPFLRQPEPKHRFSAVFAPNHS